MPKLRTCLLALGALAVLVALCVMLAAVRSPAFSPASLRIMATQMRPQAREVPPEPVRRPGVRVAPRKRLAPTDMPPGPDLPAWSQVVE